MEKLQKTIAIMQSNYVPWKGYFDLINSVDEFLVYDSCQYTQYDWRNRNRIKTPDGIRWVTVPVRRKGHLNSRIDQMRVAGHHWRRQHWHTLAHNYAKAAHFHNFKDPFQAYYLGSGDEESLSRINRCLIGVVCDMLGITTPIRDAPEPRDRSDKTSTLIEICSRTGASRLLMGPNAKNYLDVERFRASGFEAAWFDYSGYPTYPQRFGPFVHEVSILDLLFNTGPMATRYMKSFQGRP